MVNAYGWASTKAVHIDVARGGAPVRIEKNFGFRPEYCDAGVFGRVGSNIVADLYGFREGACSIISPCNLQRTHLKQILLLLHNRQYQRRNIHTIRQPGNARPLFHGSANGGSGQQCDGRQHENEIVWTKVKARANSQKGEDQKTGSENRSHAILFPPPDQNQSPPRLSTKSQGSAPRRRESFGRTRRCQRRSGTSCAYLRVHT